VSGLCIILIYFSENLDLESRRTPLIKTDWTMVLHTLVKVLGTNLIKKGIPEVLYMHLEQARNVLRLMYPHWAGN